MGSGSQESTKMSEKITTTLPVMISGSTPFLAPTACRVLERRQDNHDCVTLSIQLPENYGPWSPGQFNMLYLFGLGEVPISISGAGGELNPANRHETREICHTIRAVGSVSAALTQLEKGSTLWLRGPYGSAWPGVPEHHDVLFVAGGIGLAPLRPAIIQALATPKRGKVYVLYGARSQADLLFEEELKAWGATAGAAVHVTVDRATHVEGEEHSNWQGSVGVVTNLLGMIPLQPTHTTVMACGPDIMLRHLVSDLGALGVKDSDIYVSLERNMKCAIGLCGRCQWGPHFVCKDGPVYTFADIRRFWSIKEY